MIKNLLKWIRKKIENNNKNSQIKQINRSFFSDIALSTLYFIMVINTIIILFFVTGIIVGIINSNREIIKTPSYFYELEFEISSTTKNILEKKLNSLIISIVTFVGFFINSYLLKFFDLSFIRFIKYIVLYMFTFLLGNYLYNFFLKRFEIHFMIPVVLVAIHAIVMNFIIYPTKFLVVYNDFKSD